MEKQRIEELIGMYRDGLLGDTVPWWQSRFIDRECGGYLTYRDADGTLLSTDKPVWVLGRIIWMWSRLYNAVEPRPEWLEVAPMVSTSCSSTPSTATGACSTA